jgi:predicted nucleic acid-binding protein
MTTAGPDPSAFTVAGAARRVDKPWGHELVGDGCYVALAEQLGCGLLTSDVRLARSPAIAVPVTLV